MQRKHLSLWGAALFSAVVALNVSVGKDVPTSTKNGNAPKPENGKATAVIPKSKSAEQVDARNNKKSESETPSDQTVSGKNAADEEAIKLTGDAYVKAYRAADAKAIAALFTTDAEYTDEQGDTYQGREAIEVAMKNLFAENVGCQIALDIETIHIISPGVAVEDGTTTFTASEGADPVDSCYTAIHVKVDGQWITASVREHAPKDRKQHRAQLRQLSWLLGDWVDESEESLVLFSCEAVDGGNYLVRNFEIRIGGRPDLSGTQRIGWDPMTGKLKTWIFDSDGGYAEGFWHRDGDDWTLKTTGVTSNGQHITSTTTYSSVNDDTMTWRSTDREIAGVALPDSDPVIIVRRAPMPEIVGEVPLSSAK
jgi:uncharacterized protein (TIGR02246 family)